MKYIVILFAFLMASIHVYGQAADCSTTTITACNGNPSFPFVTNNSANTWGNVQDLPGNAAGSISDPSTNPQGVNSGCLLSGELNPTWVIIYISSSGTLAFQIGAMGSANPQAGYYDWAMWPYNASACNNIANNTLPPVACNWNASSMGGTGMGTIPPGGNAGNYQPALNVTAGQAYIMCVSNFSNISATVSINFTGSAGTSCVPTPAINSPSICLGASATLTVNTSSLPLSSPTYTWQPGGANTPSITVTPTVTSIYSLTVAGTNTISNTYTVQTTTATVTVVQYPTLTIGANSPVCAPQTLSLTANGATTYTWSGPGGYSSTAHNPIITNTSPSNSGTYTLTAANYTCASTATVSAVILPLVTPTITSNAPVCEGQTLNFSVTGADTYAWTGPNGFSYAGSNPSIPFASTGASGIYTIVATSTVTGCSSTKTITATVYPLPVPVVSSNSPVCEGQSLLLSASGGVSYSWSGPNGYSASVASPTLNPATMAMNGVYTLTATANGCSTSATLSATINALPVVTVTATSPVCAGQTVNLSAGGGNSYQWSGPNSFSSSLQSPSVTNPTPINAGVYTVSVTTLNCTTTGTVNVIVYSPMVITFSPMVPVCNNDVIQLAGPSGGSAYSWQGPAGFTASTQSPQIPNASLANSGVYTVSVIANGCMSTGTVNVSVEPPISFMSTPANSAICIGGSIQLSALGQGGSGAYNYDWMPGTLTGSLVTVSPSSTQDYTVTLSDANCPATTTQQAVVTVTVNALPVISFTADVLSGCEPLTVNFSSTSYPSSSSCLWDMASMGTVTGCNPQVTFGTYGYNTIQLTVTDINGCVSTQAVNDFINVLPKPLPSFDWFPVTPTILTNVVKFKDHSTLGGPMTNWFWNFGDPNSNSQNANTSTLPTPEHTYDFVGTYNVGLTVTNQLSCTDSIKQTLIIADELALYIPNVFTPNGDHINDVFLPQGMGFKVETFEMMIFDRWGNQIFSTNDFYRGWDGAIKGGAVGPQDTYVYKIRLKDSKDTKREYVGHVTLLP